MNVDEKTAVIETYGSLVTGMQADGQHFGMVRPLAASGTGVFAYVTTGYSEAGAISAMYIAINKAMRDVIFRKRKGRNPV